MEARVIWKDRLSFTGKSGSGFELPLGTEPEVGGDDDGFRPMELILIGLAGCTAMDVISILRKKQQLVTAFEVVVRAEKAAEHPRVFTHAQIEYIVTGQTVDPSAVERAVELSREKYCPVQAMLSKSFTIDQKITLLPG